MMPLAWNWLKRNVNLVLLLAAMTCLALALGRVIRGVTWSLLMPVLLAAAACGWGAGASRLRPRQAWVGLTALGIPGVFIYAAGLAWPLGRSIQALLALVPQVILWMYDKAPVDAGPLLVAWAELTGQVASVLARLWVWCVALAAGRTVLDPAAARLVWTVSLWLVGLWAGWQMRRNRQALQALAPGGMALALVLDYSHSEVGLVVVYLALLLTLMGIGRNEWNHIQWRQRKLDYAESIAIDTLAMVGLVTTLLVLAAAGTPSLSWRELVDRLRGGDRGGQDRVAQSLGLKAPPNAPAGEAFRPAGLPRQYLLGMPPDQLQDVALIISTGELPPIPATVQDVHPNRYYWRAVTYDLYSGVGWSSSLAQEVELPANTLLLEPPRDYRILNQRVERIADQTGSIYWSGLLAQASVDIDIAWRTAPPPGPDPGRSADMLGALTDVEEYTAVSYVPQVSASRLRAAAGDYPSGITGRYLQLPESTPERVLALARELTRAAPTPYDRAVSIESYLRTFPYTLEVEPPPFGRDVADYFLFTTQQGYCDYYATSMVVLARAAGLPARMVVGYASGDYDPQTAEYIVRQEHAHSWAEIYFAGIGWVEFEPTAAQPLILRAQEGSASGPGPGLPTGERAVRLLAARWRDLLSGLGGRVLLAGLGFVLSFSLWQLGESWFLRLLPAQRSVSRMYARMEKASARLLPDLPAGHTPHQLGTALTRKFKDGQNRLLQWLLSKAEPEIEGLVSLYVAQVFSARPPEKPQISRGIKSWLRLRWRLWIANGWLQKR
jgi:transglutaminase-like putative cysteine protease